MRSPRYNVCIIDDSDNAICSDIEPTNGFVGDERSDELESQVDGTEDSLCEGTIPVVGV